MQEVGIGEIGVETEPLVGKLIVVFGDADGELCVAVGALHGARADSVSLEHMRRRVTSWTQRYSSLRSWAGG